MRCLALSILCLACLDANAAKARELVHPYPPNGPVEVSGAVQASRMLRAMQRYAVPPLTDILADHVANALQDPSDVPVTVARKHRQGGREALSAVSRAPPDGRTLLLLNDLPFTALARDGAALAPVSLVAGMPYVLVTAADSRYAALGDLVREARNADRTLVASAGGLTVGHRALQDLRRRNGLRIEPVAYNGGHAALQAVVTRQPGAALVPLPAVLPYVAGGRLRVLAVADAQRHPGIREVPTSAEAGLGGFEAVGWFGVFAPPGTSQSLIRNLNAMLARVPEAEAARFTFESLGLRLEHRAPDAFAELLLRSAHGGRKTSDRGAS